MITFDTLYKRLPKSIFNQPSDLNIVLAVSKYNAEDVITLLQKREFKCINHEEDLLSFETDYYDIDSQKNIKINYYLYIDKKTNILVFLTTANKSIIEKTLYANFIENTAGVYYAWINPVKFQEITSNILKKYDDAVIDYFVTKRKLTYKSYARIRPHEKRSIVYRGNDGKEALDEFRQVYGMIPTLIEFLIPGRIKFKIDVQGIFTFSNGNIQLLDELANLVIDEVLYEKTILDQSKLEFVKVKSQNKEFSVPDIKQWVIHFNKAIEYADVSEILKDLNREGKFTEIENNIQKGSLFWYATFIDNIKNVVFSIKCNGERMFILPKYDQNFDSLSRFFKFFVENIDEGAKIESD